MNLRAGGLTLDEHTREARIGDRVVGLADREFRLLRDLLMHPGQVVSRERLLASVWGYDFDPQSNVVDVCVRRLRQRLGPDAPIETVRNAGYRIVVGREEREALEREALERETLERETLEREALERAAGESTQPLTVRPSRPEAGSVTRARLSATRARSVRPERGVLDVLVERALRVVLADVDAEDLAARPDEDGRRRALPGRPAAACRCWCRWSRSWGS